MDEMDEIISEFITEAEESLDRIEPLFVELEQKGVDKEMLNDIFRSMHTIKGAAGFLGFQSIVDVAHSSENIMKRLREGEISVSTQLMDVILKSIDMLRVLLGHLTAKDGIEEDVSPLVAELNSALEIAMSGASSNDPASASEDQPEEPVQKSESTLEPEPVREIEPVQETELPKSDAPPVADDIERQIEEAMRVADLVRQEQNVCSPPDNISEKEDNPVETPEPGKAEAPVEQPSTSPKPEQQKTAPARQPVKETAQKPKEVAQNLRVDVERIDKVMDLAGEVVLVRNRLLNISNYFDQKYSHDPMTETLMETVSFLDRVTSDMQLAVMKIRMQPIKKVLSKFPRFVRDMSATVNKDVELVITGEGTEVDKTVIEHIGDPLTHILRNSIDHGLESTEERISKGKPEKGKVAIDIYQKGNQVVIEIIDDGKGINVSKLKKKAIEKGLLTEEEADKMTDEAATDIIFLPGFSTKEVATELSGRGVGMDVVKTNISLLNGYVEVLTEKDIGTTFRICIPLTLAIIQSLMVEVSGAKYAIPLSPIEETLKVSRDEIDNITGQNVIVIRDKVCPLFELNDILGAGNGNGNGNDNSDHKYIVVISMGEKRFCIAVDKLLGQEEVVIKTLDGVDSTASYVLGATITGDGKVVFILDVTGMSRNLLEITSKV
jgi:two-component system chemotaxis sensor kinase CheA